MRGHSNANPQRRDDRRKSRRPRERFRQLLIESLEDRRLMARQVSGTLSADDSWSGTIQVTGDVIVPNGRRLDVATGTVIKFDTGKYLQFNDGSILNAIGSATSQIVFTSTQDDTVGEDLTPGIDGVPRRGHWESLYVNTSSASLSYVNVRYAGNISNPGNTFGPYRVPSVHIGNNATPSFQNVSLQDGENAGIDIRGNATFDTVSVERFGGVAFAQGLNLSPTYRSLTASMTGGNHVQIDGGTLTEVESWNLGGLPAHLAGDLIVGTNGELNLAPGTILKLREGRYLNANQGAIKALGTLLQPIIITSDRDDTVGGDSNADGAATVGGPGQWEALYVDNSTSRLEHVEVRYAGNVANPGNTFEPYRVAAINFEADPRPFFEI